MPGRFCVYLSDPEHPSTGGPWITEDKGMQKVVISRTPVRGGNRGPDNRSRIHIYC